MTLGYRRKKSPSVPTNSTPVLQIFRSTPSQSSDAHVPQPIAFDPTPSHIKRKRGVRQTSGTKTLWTNEHRGHCSCSGIWYKECWKLDARIRENIVQARSVDKIIALEVLQRMSGRIPGVSKLGSIFIIGMNRHGFAFVDLFVSS